MDNSISPFADPKEKNSIYNLAKEELNNIEFVKEVEEFLHISKDEILDIIDKKENGSIDYFGILVGFGAVALGGLLWYNVFSSTLWTQLRIRL